MRLGQLSRKLNVPTARIVSFIHQEFQVEIEQHPNTKIQDEFIERIEEEFHIVTVKDSRVTEKNTDNNIDNKVNEDETGEKEEISGVNEAISVESAEKNTEGKVENKISESGDEEKEDGKENKVDIEELEAKAMEMTPKEREQAELIKAPKPEVKPVKVVGKIDLSGFDTKRIKTTESKKEQKENSVEELEKSLQEAIEKPVPVKAKKKEKYKRPNKPMKKKKSVDEILAEKRREEERRRKEEDKRREEAKKREQERRRKHYEEIAKNITPPKKKKKKKKEKQTVQSKKQSQEQPKSWIGRLIEWFKTS